TQKATIHYESHHYHLQDFLHQIQTLPYHLPLHQLQLNINPITCPASSNPIQNVLNQTQPLQQATLNLTTEQPLIKY
uniref:hypothetical protein n=1 Tax=Staphylococcus epidermidis TaxID=1282 RepID=UPI0028CB816D